MTKQCFEFGKKVKTIKNRPNENCEIPNEILNKLLDKIRKENNRLTEKLKKNHRRTGNTKLHK